MQRDGRRIIFEGISNARDLGGLAAQDGRIIKEGLMLRTANLSAATEQDQADLKEIFHLDTILDLRNVQEQGELPDVHIRGVRHVDVPIIEEMQQGITHEEEAEKKPLYEIFPGIDKLYVQMVEDFPLNRNVAGAVRKVITHDFDNGAVLWHCFGGKDRCGMVAALVLSVLGVPYETVKEDYMMTNIEAGPKAEQVYANVLADGGSQREADFLYNLNIAKEEYIDSAFEALRALYGDAVNFLSVNADITEEEIRCFRERVTE